MGAKMLKISVTIYTDEIDKLSKTIKEFVARDHGRFDFLFGFSFFALCLALFMLWVLGLTYTLASFGIEVAFPFTGYFSAPHWWITIVWFIVTVTAATLFFGQKDSLDTEA